MQRDYFLIIMPMYEPYCILVHSRLADHVERRLQAEEVGFADPIKEYVFYAESLQCVFPYVNACIVAWLTSA